MNKYIPSNSYIIFDDIGISVEANLLNVKIGKDTQIFSDFGSHIFKIISKLFPDSHLISGQSIKKFHTKVISEQKNDILLSATPLIVDSVGLILSASRHFQYKPRKRLPHSFEYIGLHKRSIRFDEGDTNFLVEAKKYQGQTLDIIDDVVFSGNTILDIVESLRNRGVTVKTIYTNIILHEQIKRLENNGLTVVADFIAVAPIDIVCARDFIFGVPSGGMNVDMGNNSVGFASYILPFGDPMKWASIDKLHSVTFSKEMIKISIEFWKIIESTTGLTVTIDDLDRPPVFWPPKTRNIVDGLIYILHEEDIWNI